MPKKQTFLYITIVEFCLIKNSTFLIDLILLKTLKSTLYIKQSG